MKFNFSDKKRRFLKFSLLAAATALASIFRLRTDFAQAEAALPLLQETDSVAMKMGYNSRASKVDTSVWKKKAGPNGSSQKCNSCALFTATDGRTGTCNVFPKNSVASSGWCNAWIQRS